MREQEPSENRDVRPDHGSTQVRNAAELQVGKFYIYHAPIVGPEQSTMEVFQVLRLPTQSGNHESIYPADTYTVLVRVFFKWHIEQPLYDRNISLPELSLAKYPGNPGEWAPDRWLEDPSKIRHDSFDLTQKEVIGIIKNRMRSMIKHAWWEKFPHLPFF